MSVSQMTHLHIGEMFVAGEGYVVSTVLGSCISVCLYSPENRVGGVIHYALPTLPKNVDESSSEALRYGDYAIHLLVQQMVEMTGAKVESFRAKIVGGAAGLGDSQNQAGPGNTKIAEAILSKLKIPVSGRDVGGSRGRKILFHTGTGRLQVAQLEKEKQVSAEVMRPLQRMLETNVAKPAAVAPEQPVAKVASRKRKVLVVDDSKTIRDLLTRILSASPDLEVVGTAENPLIAEKMIESLHPDVLTLDVHMPEMDGVTFLSKLLPRRPMPVVMITSLSMQDGDTVLRAMELGAVDYIQKPNLQELPALTPVIQEKVRDASYAKVRLTSKTQATRPVSSAAGYDAGMILAIGASTGGTEAIREVLTSLPADIPPTVIVQHIPPVFSTAFAKRLDTLCPFDVKEAEDGDLLRPGLVLIAPGGKQMALKPVAGGKMKVVVNDDAPMNRHRPSVDYLFLSVAAHIGSKAVGVILTGMGNDGAKGLLEMRRQGARTLGQDEASSVVYGMPKCAYEIGAVEQVYGLSDIPGGIMKNLKRKISA